MFFSRVRSWCTQRIASIGFVAIIVLVYCAFRLGHTLPVHSTSEGSPMPAKETPVKETPAAVLPPLTKAQLLFILYTFAAHTLAFAFPIRLCWATYSITKKLRHAGTQQILKPRPRRRMKEGSYHGDCYDASISSYSESSSTSSSTFSESTEDSSPEREQPSQVSTTLLHTIIIPNYKEDLETLRETLEVLSCHRYSRSTYEICLAMEQAEADARTKASILMNEYSDKFRSVDFTVHPKGIEGEAQGKSSNLCWAAKYINGKHQYIKDKENMIITVVDSDSHLSTSYFEMINSMHQEHPETAHATIYVPPIIFDRNAHLVPSLVRVADVLWAGAGLSGHYESSSICPPTSVYSLSLALVDRVGGWDAGREAIGEDLHMYLKTFFALNGNLTTRTILSAASHSNVHTGFSGIRGFYRNIGARYNQALRHMWGALDSGFVVSSASNMWWRSEESDKNDRPHWTNTIILFHRMYEAHFLPTHITILIISGTIYTLATPAALANPILMGVLDVTGYLRVGSALLFGTFFYLYESYHSVCVDSRKREMLRAGLSDRMSGCFSYRTIRNRFDVCLFPVAGMLFGSIPTVIALTMQLWTLDIVYRVSQKPLS